VRQAKLQIANFEIALKGSRNELLPELDVVATVQNNALTGQSNSLYSASGTSGTNTGVDPALLGGYSNLLDQIVTHKFPLYSIGVQLNLPLRNRVAEADVTRDELQLRSYQTRFEQLQNQVELEVEAALIAVKRSRAAYEAAVRTRILQAQSLDVEQARFEAGISTAFFVIQYQSYLSQARSTEVVARGNYFKARAALDRALGTSLEVNRISFEQAYHGTAVHP
jgi:outer membrane protein